MYYKGYKGYLNGTKTVEALMRSSYLQGVIISLILEHLYKVVPANFRIMTNGTGLTIQQKSWCASVMVIYEKADLQAFR
jgi:hypothetical protein